MPINPLKPGNLIIYIKIQKKDVGVSTYHLSHGQALALPLS